MKISPISPNLLNNQKTNLQKVGTTFSARVPKKPFIHTVKKAHTPMGERRNISKPPKALTELNIPNYRIVNSTSLSGATFSNRSMIDLISLKEMGIDTIVDFRGEATGEFAEKCKRAGLKYYNFNLNNVINMTNPEYFLREDNERTKISPVFVDRLQKFFEMVNEGNVYMGCQFGVDRTNIGLFMNYLMNSEVENAPTIITWPYENKKSVANRNIKIVKKIVKRLTPEQRKQLGIPEDYHYMLQVRIFELLDKNKLL